MAGGKLPMPNQQVGQIEVCLGIVGHQIERCLVVPQGCLRIGAGQTGFPSPLCASADLGLISSARRRCRRASSGCVATIRLPRCK